VGLAVDVQGGMDVDCVARGYARVENSELNSIKPSSEMVSHVASNIILESGRGEAITMNRGVGGGVLDEGHVGGVF